VPNLSDGVNSFAGLAFVMMCLHVDVAISTAVVAWDDARERGMDEGSGHGSR
jgi:hypothetical protein